MAKRKTEFELKALREFVKVGHQSVAARMTKSAVDILDNSLEGLKTEVTARKLILPPHDEYKKGWNEAMDWVANVISGYEKGEGLFQ